MGKVEELVREINESNIYQKHLLALSTLEENVEVKNQVNSLRARNFQFQNESPAETMFEETNILAEEFYELRKNPMVDEYLDAELALCRMLKRVNIKLSEAIEINIPSECF